MGLVFILVFSIITIAAMIMFHRGNKDGRFNDIFDRRTYIKVIMYSGEEDVYEFSDTQQMLKFVEETKQHMDLWIPYNSRVKSYELLRRSEYVEYMNEREGNPDER